MTARRRFFDWAKKEHYMNHMFHGYEMERTMLLIRAINMITRGVENLYIEYRDRTPTRRTPSS